MSVAAAAWGTRVVEDAVRDLELRGMVLWVEGDQLRFRGPRAAQNAADLQLLSARKAEALAYLTQRQNRAPVTISQRLWLRSDRHMVPIEYRKTPLLLELEGPLDQNLLSRALEQLRERHEMLRTRYVCDDDGVLFQTTEGVEPQDAPPYADVSGKSEPEHAKEIWGLVREQYLKDPDYDRGHPMQVWLYRLANGRHVLVTITDHIALDNRTMALVLGDLFRLYSDLVAGQPSTLPPVGASYADYARSMQARQGMGAMGANLGWWREKIGEMQCVDLRDPKQRWEGPGSRQIQPFRFPKEAAERAGEMARNLGVPVSVILSAVFGALMARWTDKQRIVTGYLVDDRPSRMALTAGAFIRTSPLIVDLRGDPTVREFIQRVRQAHLHTIDPDRAIFSRDIPRLPQTLLNLQQPIMRRVGQDRGGVTVKPWDNDSGMHPRMTTDFQVNLRIHSKFLVGHVLFTPDRVNPEAVRWFCTGSAVLLDRMVHNPDDAMSVVAPPRTVVV